MLVILLDKRIAVGSLGQPCNCAKISGLDVGQSPAPGWMADCDLLRRSLLQVRSMACLCPYTGTSHPAIGQRFFVVAAN
jgi:hypothetical protein